jgi:hypothetical protein
MLLLSEQYSQTLVNVDRSPNKNHHFGEAVGEVHFFYFLFFIFCNLAH